MKFISPLQLMVGLRKKFILNLNQYRNTHFRVLNYAKQLYKDWMKPQIIKSKKKDKIITVYKVYANSNRHYDVGNVCCVHEKFFEDAFVELGKLPDDIQFRRSEGSSTAYRLSGCTSPCVYTRRYRRRLC